MEREPIEICEVSVIHEDVLTRVKAKMPDEEPVDRKSTRLNSSHP